LKVNTARPPHYAGFQLPKEVVFDLVDHVKSHYTMAGGWTDRTASSVWPARSPDIIPTGFFFHLWGYVTNLVYKVKYNYLTHFII
jgi:hypothetical protein